MTSSLAWLTICDTSGTPGAFASGRSRHSGATKGLAAEIRLVIELAHVHILVMRSRSF